MEGDDVIVNKSEDNELMDEELEDNSGSQSIEIIVQNNSDERLDKYLTSLPEIEKFSISRTKIQKMVKDGQVLINGKETKISKSVKKGDKLSIVIPSEIISPKDFSQMELQKENIPLDIIYQDSHIAVINKPSGLQVHPGPGEPRGTLANALLFHFGTLSTIGGKDRPGIVHRLDKDTSGLMVIARSDESHLKLKEQFQNRTTVKKYAAIVIGKPRDSTSEKSPVNIINQPLARHPKNINKMVVSQNGKEAITEYSILKTWQMKKNEIYSLLDIRIRTGRTHQIRAHLSHIGNPIVGDPIYSSKHSKQNVPYLLLSSKHLEFLHPITNQPMKYTIDLPSRFVEFMQILDKEVQ